MKVVILEGAHNKKGMTLRLVNNFVTGIKSVNPKASITIYDLRYEKIEFCKGCGLCTKDTNPVNAKCTINDITTKIKNEALRCDILVFATPIYEFCVSSSMKRFLERCLTLVTFRFGITSRIKAITNKQGVILCSSGAPFPFNHLMGITRYPKFILKLACKLYGCSKIDMIFAGGMEINKKMENKWCNKAFQLGVKTTNRYQKLFLKEN